MFDSCFENISPYDPDSNTKQRFNSRGKILSNGPSSNIWVATVSLAQWVFKNTCFIIFADKIYFDLKKNKVLLVNNELVTTIDNESYYHDIVKYNLNLTKNSKLPTLELKNLTENNFVKIAFSENKQNPHHQPGCQDISLTESLSDFKLW